MSRPNFNRGAAERCERGRQGGSKTLDPFVCLPTAIHLADTECLAWLLADGADILGTHCAAILPGNIVSPQRLSWTRIRDAAGPLCLAAWTAPRDVPDDADLIGTTGIDHVGGVASSLALAVDARVLVRACGAARAAVRRVGCEVDTHLTAVRLAQDAIALASTLAADARAACAHVAALATMPRVVGEVSAFAIAVVHCVARADAVHARSGAVRPAGIPFGFVHAAVAVVVLPVAQLELPG